MTHNDVADQLDVLAALLEQRGVAPVGPWPAVRLGPFMLSERSRLTLRVVLHPFLVRLRAERLRKLSAPDRRYGTAQYDEVRAVLRSVGRTPRRPPRPVAATVRSFRESGEDENERQYLALFDV